MDPATLVLLAEGRLEYITQPESHSFRWAPASFYSYPLNFSPNQKKVKLFHRVMYSFHLESRADLRRAQSRLIFLKGIFQQC